MTVDVRRLRLLALSLFIGTALGGLSYLSGQSAEASASILAISALMAISIPTESGIRYSLALAPVAAAPLVLLSDSLKLDPLDAGLVLVLGSVGAHIYLAIIGSGVQAILISFLRTLIDGAAYISVFVVALYVSFDVYGAQAPEALTLSISVATFVWFLVDITLWSTIQRSSSRQTWRHHFVIGIQTWPVAASILATGVFFGIALEFTPWWWALSVSMLPYAFAHVAFLRAHETRRTYRQTIRALSRIPEVSALSPDGHGDRTASLALDVARELGMSPSDIHDLEFAAQMHDIGRITLNQPSILRMGFTDEDIARWGSEMVAEVAYLKNVSQLVLKQHEPYRRPGEQKDPDLAMGSKIIKAASAYDHATTELGFMPVEALEVLHRGAAYDYDPDVVVAIRAVLERLETV